MLKTMQRKTRQGIFEHSDVAASWLEAHSPLSDSRNKAWRVSRRLLLIHQSLAILCELRNRPGFEQKAGSQDTTFALPKKCS
jgi:hypothetical protein